MANNRIAYGLAKQYGINTEGMKPKEVWDALASKGINQDNYQQYQYMQNESYDNIQKNSIQEENDYSELDNYKIPKESVVRKTEDAKKWELYDRDYKNFVDNEPNITKDIDEISETLKMPLIGRDFRIKGKASYDRKVNVKRLSGEYKQLGDVVRYTFEHSMDNPVGQIGKNLEALKQKGYKIIKVDNRWKDDGAYNGINVDVVSPAGIPIEIQYHTKNNHKIKETLHKDYEVLRDSRTPQHIKVLAKKRMDEAKKLWEIPNNIKEI